MHAIGVDIGGTKIAAGVVDDEGRILAQTRRDTDASDADAVDVGVIEVVRELAGAYDVGAIGLAAPGFVSSDQATVLLCPNLPWRDHPLRDRVAAGLGTDLPIVVENDANAAGWAEFRFGVGRDVQDMLLLTIGTGLGGALVVGGRLVRGAYGVAAEVGHMRVVPDGHLCGCGLHGCWEQYASGRALVRSARTAAANLPESAVRMVELSGGGKIKGPAITTAAQEGDPLAISLLAELGRWIGEGSASVAALLDPALVVIGGGVGAAGDLLLGPTRAAFLGALSARGFRPEARIELAAMGNDAGIVGAADLARLEPVVLPG
jgi:glucokinase